MHARDDDYVFAHHAIEYRVRKASNETPPSVPVTHGIACGVRLDGAQGGPYRIEELVAQPGSLLFVPAIRRLDIRGGGRPKDDDHPELRIRWTTSSHGIPVGPSCSRSSSRRSSSARCASVSGTASGVSQRLSQSSSTSWSRSAGVSFDISKTGLGIRPISPGCARAASRPRCLGAEHGRAVQPTDRRARRRLGDLMAPNGPGMETPHTPRCRASPPGPGYGRRTDTAAGAGGGRVLHGPRPRGSGRDREASWPGGPRGALPVGEPVIGLSLPPTVCQKGVPDSWRSALRA